MTREQISVIHVGLGPIGCSIARLVAARPALRSAAAVDVAPDKVGRALSEVATTSAGGGVSVRARPEDVDVAPGAVVVHSTGSSLADVAPQLLSCVERGWHVVSTCEELSYPWDAAPALAAELDRAAREAGVVVLGTGVNPGFAMDYLPIVLSGASASVTGVIVHRVQDAGARRLGLQRKVGATLTLSAFAERVEAGAVRHVGLVESAQAIAAAFGWLLDDLSEEISPLLASEPTPSALGIIAPGHVVGIHQVVQGSAANGAETVCLTLDMGVGLPAPRDEIELRGDPGARMIIPGGLPGDVATAAVTTNCVTRMSTTRAGLRIMAELAPPHPTDPPRARHAELGG